MALSIGWILLLIISIIAFVVLLIIFILTLFNEKEKKYDSVIALNFLSNKANGRFIGEVENVIEGKGGRWVNTLRPWDTNVNSREPVENEIVIVNKLKRIPVGKGVLSKDRNVEFWLPNKEEDLSEGMRDNVMGIALVWASMLQNKKDIVEKIMREGTDRRDALLKKIGDGEISEDFIKQTEGLVKDYLERIVNPKETSHKHVPTLNPSGTASSHGP